MSIEAPNFWSGTQDHSPEKSKHRKSRVTVRPLDPNNPADREITRDLDLKSLDAINPITGKPYDPMTPSQRNKWISDDPDSMVRVIQIGKKVVGFVYISRDTQDHDFNQRLEKVQENMGLDKDQPGWEANFYITRPKVADEDVEEAMRQTLNEFSERVNQPTTLVMFVDAGDMQAAYRKAVKRPVNIRELRANHAREAAEKRLQDTRVLLALGFLYFGRIQYEEGKGKPSDFAYAQIFMSQRWANFIAINQSLTPDEQQLFQHIWAGLSEKEKEGYQSANVRGAHPKDPRKPLKSRIRRQVIEDS